MNRRRGAGQVINLVHFKQDRFNHIVSQQFKARVAQQSKNVDATAGKEIVEADYIVSLGDQPLTKMGTDKACSACYKYAHKISLEFPVSRFELERCRLDFSLCVQVAICTSYLCDLNCVDSSLSRQSFSPFQRPTHQSPQIRG